MCHGARREAAEGCGGGPGGIFGGGGRAHGPTTASWLHRPSLNPSTDPSAHLSANLNPYPDIDTDASLTPAPVLTLILGLANRIPALTLALPLTLWLWREP